MSLFVLIDEDPVTNFIHEKQISRIVPHANIEIFSSGLKALEFLKNLNTNHTLILLDINMALFSGWDFLKEFQKQTTRAKCNLYILSSSIDKADRDRALSHPLVVDYLEKPLSSDTIRKIYNPN